MRMGMLLFLLGVLLATQGCAVVEPTGRMMVDGRPIAHAIAGQGSPTIILEAGLGNGMDSWVEIFPKLAEIGTVFAYDRPGYSSSRTDGERLGDLVGFLPGSELVDVGRMLGPSAPATTGAMAADRLDRILSDSGLPPPYILVGHSLGGQYVLIYAARHPEKVAGILLVDSRPKGFTAACLERGLSPCEVPGLLRSLMPAPMQAEIDGLADTDAQTPHPVALGRIPVIRLVATQYSFTLNAAFHALWVEMQRAEAAAQSVGRIELVEGAGHDIIADRPDAVSAAIRDLAAQVKANSGGTNHKP